MRSLGVPQSVARHLKIKQRQRGYDEATFVESFVLLNGVGGECLDDFEQLRADGGLAEMLGHALPSPEAARNFLYEFHSEENIEIAKQQRSLGEIAYIPGENTALRGLGGSEWGSGARSRQALRGAADRNDRPGCDHWKPQAGSLAHV
jgi:hypothetical protein